MPYDICIYKYCIYNICIYKYPDEYMSFSSERFKFYLNSDFSFRKHFSSGDVGAFFGILGDAFSKIAFPLLFPFESLP